MNKPCFLIGIDEVGRGPLAGPVTVCAFAVEREMAKTLLSTLLSFGRSGAMHDSKTLSFSEREKCLKRIRNAKKGGKVWYAVSSVSAKIIDRIGIVGAVKCALYRSLRRININPRLAHVFLDGGLRAPAIYQKQETIIKGDQKIPVIALASIVAKVHRDRKMRRLAVRYPHWGFYEHVGYGTSAHYRAIKKHGLSDLHRRSFLKGL